MNRSDIGLVKAAVYRGKAPTCIAYKLNLIHDGNGDPVVDRKCRRGRQRPCFFCPQGLREAVAQKE